MARFVNASDDGTHLLVFVNADKISRIWGFELVTFSDKTTKTMVKLRYCDGSDESFYFSSLERAEEFMKNICIEIE